jgi:hypothetical protein
MTRKTYCGNILWQSGLTLLARRLREYCTIATNQLLSSGQPLTMLDVD